VVNEVVREWSGNGHGVAYEVVLDREQDLNFSWCRRSGRILAAAALLAAFVLVTARDPARAENAPPRFGAKAVIELFTSQGCSSCPPADRLMGELALDPSLVVMSLAVDYWDYLGWKDTLALKGHAKRQHAYAKTRGDREVYTPQVVVNGLVHVAGNDRAAIERAVEMTRRESKAMRLNVGVTRTADALVVEIPDAQEVPAGAEVWLLPISLKVPVSIERGENRGKTVIYTNVVRRWLKLGEWKGKAESFTVALKDVQAADIDSVAVLVQNGGSAAPGTVLGAAIISVR
jgi:hypothetical protein